MRNTSVHSMEISEILVTYRRRYV